MNWSELINMKKSEDKSDGVSKELERVAAQLDGEGQNLDPEQLALARQIRQNLTWLGSQLDVNVDDEMLLRINSRLCEALAAAAEAAAVATSGHTGLYCRCTRGRHDYLDSP